MYIICLSSLKKYSLSLLLVLCSGGFATNLSMAKVGCVICGGTSLQRIIISTSMTGPSDLDMRTSYPDRGANHAYVQHCPNCDYCAYNISELICGNMGLIKSIIESEPYGFQIEDSTLPEYANYFLCRALIEEGCGNYGRAGWSALRAAWECDDKGGVGSSVRCRQRALVLLEIERQRNQTFASPEGAEEALLGDIFRRCGEFEAALVLFQQGLDKDSEGMVKAVLRFQIKLAEKRDSSRHTTGEIHYIEPLFPKDGSGCL